MKADFSGGTLHSTDYFQSRDREAGRAWLIMQGSHWHVLLPRLCAMRPTAAIARPVTDSQERDGWRWRLELGEWFVPLPRPQIIGPRPLLPEPYTTSDRTLTLYATETHPAAGQSFFGSIQPGIQIHATCHLYLVRDVRPRPRC